MNSDLTFSGYSLRRLKHLLDPLDYSPTECDGMSNLVSHYLTVNNISHVVRTGYIINRQGEVLIPWHSWIELAEDSDEQMWRVDYRCRMWLPDLPDIPHGIVLPKPEHPVYMNKVTYKGKKLPEILIQVLLGN